MEEGDVLKVHCNVCGSTTQHTVIAVRDLERTPEDYPGNAWTESYAMLECGGCRDILFRCKTMDTISEEMETSFYPPPLARRRPDWLHELPDTIRTLLWEVYAAMTADCPTLATMGARSLIDLVVIEKVGDLGPFRLKLAALEERGFIGRAHREHLEAALDAGHAAIHRAFTPSVGAVNHAIEIVESLLHAVYVLPKAARQLKRVTPARRRRRRKNGAV